MLRLGFESEGPIRNILCLGAHCDDIEIGCGGTLMRLLQENPAVTVDWVIFSSDEAREQETRAAAMRVLGDESRIRIRVERFRNGFFPYLGKEIKEYFEKLKSEVDPDLIFTHYRNDLHQDHRTLCELTWNTFRDHLILEYEIPKYDGDLGAPNFFVPLDEELCKRKAAIITECFQSQSDKHWCTESTFLALARLRGLECATGFAEAFYSRKITI